MRRRRRSTLGPIQKNRGGISVCVCVCVCVCLCNFLFFCLKRREIKVENLSKKERKVYSIKKIEVENE